jgi:3-deoxy-alpha-D-manno-octulosonate 8-oxidase
VFFVDHYFDGRDLVRALPATAADRVIFVDSTHEPTTDYVDALYARVRAELGVPAVVVGVGGGTTLDMAKAVSNLLANGGAAADYQGWDLVPRPGVFKIGVPTLSGTGAEASRTCVMMNQAKNLKLGMNSDHTVYDRLVLDPDLTASVPRDQYFYTGLDTYIHCIESLAGRHRHAVADAYAREANNLCREIFLGGDMMGDDNREKMMVASYLGGCAIGNSFVGVVHPLSAGLSMVLGTHHCLSNCVVMDVMDEFYPDETAEFRAMARTQKVEIPKGLCRGLDDDGFQRLYAATVVHAKPLANALGDDFGSILTFDKVSSLFRRM